MQITRRFTGALIIAVMTAATLHFTAQPAAADTGSWCAQITATIINIQSSEAPQEAKDQAIAALTSIKKYVLFCGD